MTRYEGMFILTDVGKPEEQEDRLGVVREEIEKLGGTVVSTTRLGKRTFVRVLQKQDAGLYAVITFDIDGAQLPALHARYNLSADVIRAQFIRVDMKKAAAAAAAAEEAAAVAATAEPVGEADVS